MKNKIFPINTKSTGLIDMYCLPSAGSSASMYFDWVNYAPEWLNICPVEYSGHGTRVSESLIYDPNIVTNEITDAILTKNHKKFILFGHSLGTALTWRIVKELQERGQESRLGMIIISGRRETGTLSNERRKRHLLPRKEFITEVSKYAGLPQELLDQNDILDFFLPILRNDFHLNDFLMDDAPVFTHCPLITIAGDSDPDIPSPEMMTKWAKYSKTWLGHYSISGGHFYLNESENTKRIIEIISSHSHFIFK
ncbi:thioesterase domain-containing protein [Brenneria sp. g21c3]|uniref:thioesterase II family protein n=1 Tax=Brenneria sp. g21c3 TaxID=3093893 RepID=UPI002E9C9A5E|nr:thioesterase domain-containing protein [Brenneria sp. g21c3]